jgi:hypothetical protein
MFETSMFPTDSCLVTVETHTDLHVDVYIKGLTVNPFFFKKIGVCVYQIIPVKVHETKFREYSFRGSRVVACGQTDVLRSQ